MSSLSHRFYTEETGIFKLDTSNYYDLFAAPHAMCADSRGDFYVVE
jgi:hypothetical protein